jgi:hypothetical protein
MIAERNFKLLSTAQISSYLLETSLNGDLQKSEYDEIMAELKTRDIHPEALASLVVLGDPEWYSDRLRVVRSES